MCETERNETRSRPRDLSILSLSVAPLRIWATYPKVRALRMCRLCGRGTRIYAHQDRPWRLAVSGFDKERMRRADASDLDLTCLEISASTTSGKVLANPGFAHDRPRHKCFRPTTIRRERNHHLALFPITTTTSQQKQGTMAQYDVELKDFKNIFSLDGKVAVVSGGSRGLGLHAASGYASSLL